MTDYRDRIVKVLYVPCDERIATAVFDDKTIRELLKMADIEFWERVNTQIMHDHDLVMMIDDDGRDNRKSYNLRAHFLSGYPVHEPIVGDAIFCSEAMVGDGMDMVDISDKGLAYFEMMRDAEGEQGFAGWQARYGQYLESHHFYFPPQPTHHKNEFKRIHPNPIPPQQ